MAAGVVRSKWAVRAYSTHHYLLNSSPGCFWAAAGVALKAVMQRRAVTVRQHKMPQVVVVVCERQVATARRETRSTEYLN